MNQLLFPDDVYQVIGSFLDINEGDEATKDLLLSVGAEMLDVSVDTFCDLLEEKYY